MKSPLCMGCPIYEDLKSHGKEPSPIETDYKKDFHLDSDGNIDVLFVGHALNSGARRPFEGNAGKYLREYIKLYGIVYYGVTNIHKCRLAYQTHHAWATSQPGKRCRDVFINEMRCGPKLVVALGSPASLVLTGRAVSEMPDAIVNVKWNGQEFSLIALPHPSPLHVYNDLVLLEVWNRRWIAIGDFSKEGV